MAQLALAGAGALVGSAFGAPYLGFALGSLLGGVQFRLTFLLRRQCDWWLAEKKAYWACGLKNSHWLFFRSAPPAGRPTGSGAGRAAPA